MIVSQSRIPSLNIYIYIFIDVMSSIEGKPVGGWGGATILYPTQVKKSDPNSFMKHGGASYPPQRKSSRLVFFFRRQYQNRLNSIFCCCSLSPEKRCLAGEHCASLVFLSSKTTNQREKTNSQTFQPAPAKVHQRKPKLGIQGLGGVQRNVLIFFFF